MDVVVQRYRGEQQHVPAQGRDRRDGTPRRVAGMARGTAQAVGLVDDQQVDPGHDGLLRQAWVRDQRLERDHGAPVDVERVEAGTVIARHVGEPGVVEQHEDLVVLAPELAQPLDGQRLGSDHEAALGAAGPQQAAQDQAGLDRLAEADLVGEQPAHGVAGRRALGRVQLVWEEADAPAEERAEAAGLAQLEQVQRVEAGREVLDRIDVAEGEPLDEVARRVDRPELVGCDLAPVGEPDPSAFERSVDPGLFARRGDPDPAAGRQIEALQRGLVGGEAQHGRGTRELDDDRSPLDRGRRAPARARGCGGAPVDRRRPSSSGRDPLVPRPLQGLRRRGDARPGSARGIGDRSAVAPRLDPLLSANRGRARPRSDARRFVDTHGADCYTLSVIVSRGRAAR